MSRASFSIALIVLLTPLLATAQIERGNWELTLAATGTANNDFNESAVGASAGLGYFVFDNLELSVRQLIANVNTNDGNAFNAGSTLALDLHFPIGHEKRIVPFIGGNAAYYYGDTIQDSFEYGPEGGVKYFVNSTTFVFLRAEYQIYEHGVGGSSNSEDQQYVFTLGIGFQF
jgi:hypothetical protein